MAKQAGNWSRLSTEYRVPVCVAGDFNVNLGGPHYYGSEASKKAIAQALKNSGLVALTDFERTKEMWPTYGLVDHIAVSEQLAGSSSPPVIWSRTNDAGEAMSDHEGVALDLDVGVVYSSEIDGGALRSRQTSREEALHD